MTLPRSFKSWAVVGGRLTPMVVDTKDGTLLDAWPTGGGQDPLVVDAEAVRECRAWAVKALAWLKAEAVRPSVTGTRLGWLERENERALEHLRKLSAYGGAVGVAAKEAYLARCGDLMGPLRAAHMEDLVDRCAEEMLRQAEEAVTNGGRCCPSVPAGMHLVNCPLGAP